MAIVQGCVYRQYIQTLVSSQTYFQIMLLYAAYRSRFVVCEYIMGQ